jgi:hypothetical protein
MGVHEAVHWQFLIVWDRLRCEFFGWKGHDVGVFGARELEIYGKIEVELEDEAEES